jgi:hypothetical protein
MNIHLAVAGGDHPSRGNWLPGYSPQGNEEIVLPKNWNDLLAQAEKDLGPAPESD